MSQPLISIVTVNYKQPVTTCELLVSINQLSYKNLEVIVVDNESTEDYTWIFQEYYKNTIVMRNEKNLGFAGANNQGIQNATGEYILLLNNDTILPEGTLESLVEKIEATGAAAISPVIKYFDHPDQIQYAGFTELNKFTGRNKLIQQTVNDLESYETPYFHGAAVLIKKEVIDKVGLMPEGYFLYYEELAWGRSFRKHGYKLAVDPESFILHKESVSTGKASPLKVFYQTRNRLAFMKRYSSSKDWIVFLTYFSSVGFLYNLVKYAVSRKPQHMAALVSGVVSFFRIRNNELKLNF